MFHSLAIPSLAQQQFETFTVSSYTIMNMHVNTQYCPEYVFFLAHRWLCFTVIPGGEIVLDTWQKSNSWLSNQNCNNGE